MFGDICPIMGTLGTLNKINIGEEETEIDTSDIQNGEEVEIWDQAEEKEEEEEGGRMNDEARERGQNTVASLTAFFGSFTKN